MIIWFALSIFVYFHPEINCILIGLVIVGVTAGATTFLVYLHFFYVVYGFFTLAFFGLSILLKGELFFYEGIGLITLFLFLSNMAIQYHNLLKKYYDSLETNSQLIETESQQVQEIGRLNASIKKNINQRSIIENKIMQSIEEIRKLNQNMVNKEIELKGDLSFLLEKLDSGVLYIEKYSQKYHVNNLFSNQWDLEIGAFEKMTDLVDHLKQQITGSNYFSLNFPFPIHGRSLAPFKIQKNKGGIFEVRVLSYQDQASSTYVWIFKDITETEIQEEMNELGMADSLTQLPNRRTVYTRIQEFIHSHENKDRLFALVFMDINNFKLINDSLGHKVGNDVLIEFAKRLKKAIRPIDVVGRLGGDEFICILSNLQYKSDVDPLINKIIKKVQSPIKIDGQRHLITTSMGISFFPCDSINIDKLISYADIAMYKAKEKKGTVFYERYIPEYSQKISHKQYLSEELRSAIINDNFYLVFQPIYNIEQQDWVKVEVLLRWRDQVGPDVFIPLANEIGLMNEIGLWVLEQSCQKRLELLDHCDKPIRFSINISAEQLKTAEDIDRLLETIRQTKCPPELLEFEFTEDLLFDLDKAQFFIQQLKELGVTTALDDFGIGYSSFSYLQNLHFDSVKIDKQFLRSIFSDPREMNLICSIINICHSLNTEITVEGVETKEHYTFCEKQGCHNVQGYYIAKPCDFNSIVDKLCKN